MSGGATIGQPHAIGVATVAYSCGTNTILSPPLHCRYVEFRWNDWDTPTQYGNQLFVYSAFLSLWCTSFTESWKRRQVCTPCTHPDAPQGAADRQTDRQTPSNGACSHGYPARLSGSWALLVVQP
eukprot:SAG22_NODE_2582_length_2417_cov_2.970233_2_plen_125_part_00